MARKVTASADDLRMVDSMVAGGQSLDQIESYFSGTKGKGGIIAAVKQRRAELAVASHSQPQPAGPPAENSAADFNPSYRSVLTSIG